LQAQSTDTHKIVLQRIWPDVVLYNFTKLVSTSVVVVKEPAEERLLIRVWPLVTFLTLHRLRLGQILNGKLSATIHTMYWSREMEQEFVKSSIYFGYAHRNMLLVTIILLAIFSRVSTTVSAPTTKSVTTGIIPKNGVRR